MDPFTSQMVSEHRTLLWIAGIVLVLSNVLILWLGNIRRKGRQGERNVVKCLANGLPDGYILLNDVYLPRKGGGTTQIDHIVVSQYGIFVIETKNYSGWIFGRENDAEWTETFPRQKHHFPNPIRQNYAHICALAECLGISKDYFHGVVAFTEKCTFKTPMPDGVVYTVGLADYIKSFNRVQIDPSQVPETVEAIRKWAAEVGENPAKAHVAFLNRKKHGGLNVV